MLYRENGQFKSSYAADQQLLPIAQDRWFMVGLIAFAYLAMPVLASDYMFRALIIPFVILAIAAIGLNILVGYCGQISIGQRRSWRSVRMRPITSSFGSRNSS